jgi:hypothetical protein
VSQLAELTERVAEHFSRVHREVFLGDELCNPKLWVEIVAPAMAADAATMILIAPWTLNGLVFPPDGSFPASLTIGAKDHPVFTTDVEGLGVIHSLNLASDVSTMPSQDAARGVAAALAPKFLDAVTRAREARAVSDPSRRRLLGLDE